MTQHKRFLAIETSTSACSAAVLSLADDRVQVFEQWQNAPRQHTSLLLPMIDKVLAQAQCQLQQINYLAFGRGPGAFTGVRIATSVIQALSFATQKPVIAVSSLAALAQAAFEYSHRQHIIVANDARMNEIYLGCYIVDDEKVTACGQEKLVSADELVVHVQEFIQQFPDWLAVGSAWEVFKPQLGELLQNGQLVVDNDRLSLPHAAHIARLARRQQPYPGYEVENIALPVYLRNHVAKKMAVQKSIIDDKK